MARNYLGASAWSHCDRKMWLKYRNAFDKKIDDRLQRTFDIGHALEPVIIADMERRGFVVRLREAELVGKWGQPIGHVDGVVRTPEGELKLLEMKTANDKSWNNMVKAGIPDYYYAQVQIYMHLSGQIVKSVPRLTKTHYVIINKNTSELHEFDADYSAAFAETEYDRMHAVIESEDMPPKNESWKCKMCEFSEFCEFGMIPNISCKTCANVTIVNGNTECTRGSEPCGSHLFHPAFMQALGHEIVSADSENLTIDYGQMVHGPVNYKHHTKDTFTSAEYAEYFKSRERTDETAA